MITMVGALINPPDWLLEAYRSGQCVGIAELYELRRAHDCEPDAARAMLARAEPITRSSMRLLRNRRSTVEREAAESHSGSTRTTAEPLTPRSQATAASLMRRADQLCAELDAVAAQLKQAAPERLADLRSRIAAIAAA